MFTKAFWRNASERAAKTFAQALAALLVADGTDLLGTAWVDRLSVAGMAAFISVLTTIGTSKPEAKSVDPAARNMHPD